MKHFSSDDFSFSVCLPVVFIIFLIAVTRKMNVFQYILKFSGRMVCDIYEMRYYIHQDGRHAETSLTN